VKVRIPKFIAISTIFLFLSTSLAHASGEIIKKFNSEVSIYKNGVVNVRETIVYDFSTLQRHGIFRDIPYTLKNSEGKEFEMPITVLSVKNEYGQDYKYTQSRTGGNVSLKIGDPNKTITGAHTYVITYEVEGTLEEFSDHDELYWNVTGNEWKVPIETSSVRLLFPSDVPVSNLKIACFTGPFGSKEVNCSQVYDLLPSLFVTTTKYLNPNEGFTIVAGFDKGYITVIPKKEVSKLPEYLVLAGLFIWYFLLPLSVILMYLKYGRDPKINTAIPALFEPPLDGKRRLTPAESGTIVDESADDKDITATIVDLAIRGYLKITEKDQKSLGGLLSSKDYILTREETYKNKEGEVKLEKHEEALINSLFKDGDEVSTADLLDSFSKDAQNIKDNLYKNAISNGFFPHNPKTVRDIWLIVGFLSLFTINVPLGVVCIVFSRVMPRKTLKGAKSKVDILGLKRFVSSQERQLKFQEENWYLFEKLLPYAIALGVADVWAKRFEKLGEIPQRTWYTGNSSFNSYTFANSLGSLGTSVARAATPTSSSSGFSSGFSGGSSGGGGGGGGGGSW